MISYLLKTNIYYVVHISKNKQITGFNAGKGFKINVKIRSLSQRKVIFKNNKRTFLKKTVVEIIIKYSRHSCLLKSKTQTKN